jgi:hypothetical protein
MSQDDKNVLEAINNLTLIVQDFLNKYELKQLASPEEICLTRIMNSTETPKRIYWAMVRKDAIGRRLFRRSRFFDHIDQIAAEHGWVETQTKEAERTWFASQGDYDIYSNPKKYVPGQELDSIAISFFSELETEGSLNIVGWMDRKLGWKDNDPRREKLGEIANDLTLTDEWADRVRHKKGTSMFDWVKEK